MITYLTAHIFEICDLNVRCPQWAMHLLEWLHAVISSNTLCHNIIEEVPDEVHLWEVPAIL